jgi:hypothetical protein
MIKKTGRDLDFFTSNPSHPATLEPDAHGIGLL